MRKSLALVLGLSLVAIMAYGAIGSAAWFTSSDSVAVTATSGKIVVTGSPTPITLSNLMPGVWTDPLQFKIYNHGDSTVPVKFRVTSQYVSQSIDGFYAQILVKADSRNCDGSVLAGNPVYQNLLMNLQFDSNTTPTLFAAGLPINYTACYNLSFKLLNATPNTFQNQTVHFNLVIDATQLENPGWAE